METFRFKQSHGVARGIFLLAFALMCRSIHQLTDSKRGLGRNAHTTH